MDETMNDAKNVNSNKTQKKQLYVVPSSSNQKKEDEYSSKFMEMNELKLKKKINIHVINIEI